MEIKKTAEEIWREFERGVDFNNGINLYENVERNENFYNDRQWEGLNAPDLDKPVFNFLKPVVNYYVSTLISDDISANIELCHEFDREDAVRIPGIVSGEVASVIEGENIKTKLRKIIRNCAVDGDACMYFYFQPSEKGNFWSVGDIKSEIVDNTSVIFGNPCESDVQKQPYILIAYRRLLGDVRDEAVENGVDPETIVPDDCPYYSGSERDLEQSYVTVILKMWKENGTVKMTKITKNTVLKKEVDTEFNIYPLAYFSWEAVKNCYHGASPLTGKIHNQTFVNKLYAMAMEYTKKMAFPKLLYDRTKIPEGVNNAVGKAIAVTGNPADAFFADFKSADFSSQVTELINATITQTKEMMGAYDAALGNVAPDNTSAIIATQKAAAAPLDIQKMDYYAFVEDCVRIIIELMRVCYGVKNTVYTDENGDKVTVCFDFSALGKLDWKLKVDIGQSSYWSEILQIQTLDNLMKEGVIPGGDIYLESLPDGYVKNRKAIIEKIREREESGV